MVINHITTTSNPMVGVGRMLEVDLGLMVEHRMLVVANRIDLDLVSHSQLEVLQDSILVEDSLQVVHQLELLRNLVKEH